MAYKTFVRIIPWWVLVSHKLYVCICQVSNVICLFISDKFYKKLFNSFCAFCFIITTRPISNYLLSCCSTFFVVDRVQFIVSSLTFILSIEIFALLGAEDYRSYLQSLLLLSLVVFDVLLEFYVQTILSPFIIIVTISIFKYLYKLKRHHHHHHHHCLTYTKNLAIDHLPKLT